MTARNSKWIEFNADVHYKRQDLGVMKTREIKCAVCVDPPLECAEHPEKENVSLFTNQYGTKEVKLPFQELLALLKA